MIQRIQSLYLLGVLAALTLLLVLPFGEIVFDTDTIVFYSHGMLNSRDGQGKMLLNTYPLLAIVIAAMIITLMSILKYRNRKRQMQLGKLNILLCAVIISLVFYYFDKGKSLVESPNDALVNYKISTILPVIAIILTWLANRAISKDEELVRSADRLR